MYHHFENKQALGYAVMEEIRFTMGDIFMRLAILPDFSKHKMRVDSRRFAAEFTCKI